MKINEHLQKSVYTTKIEVVAGITKCPDEDIIDTEPELQWGLNSNSLELRSSHVLLLAVSLGKESESELTETCLVKGMENEPVVGEGSTCTNKMQF